MDKSTRIGHYEAKYLEDYGFEAVMVRYRRRMLLERLHLFQPKVVVEIGCGTELLYQAYLEQDGHAEQWIVVEPSPQFHAIALNSRLPGLTALHGFFEHSIEKISAQLSAPPDFIVCSSLLHEIQDPIVFLEAVTRIMKKDSILHVNVPNAASMHRRLARSMGLIDNLTTPSSRNRQLFQHHVYDQASLCKIVGGCGLNIFETGGYFIKPFTHQQMESIRTEIEPAVFDGLYQLGKELPELASEIFIEARLR